MRTTNLALMVLLASAAGAAGGILVRAIDGEEAPARAAHERVPAPDLDRILNRLAALEARGGVRAHDGASAAGDDATAVERRAEPKAHEEAKVAPPAPGAPPDPLAGTLGRPFGYRESEVLFERLARDRSSIADVIRRLEKEIAANPRNADLHVALATAYGAKTAFDTPPGPEQGTVWAKAELAYDEAIRLDPAHWQARYGKAFGDSMAPEFVGLRPRAIRQFEELVEIQEKQPKAPEHVEVYMRLGTLHKDAGNVKKAREIWQRGLERFPDDERLVEALSLAEEK